MLLIWRFMSPLERTMNKLLSDLLAPTSKEIIQNLMNHAKTHFKADFSN